jgi:hypothetical protein
MASGPEKRLKMLLSQIQPHADVVTFLQTLRGHEGSAFDRSIAIVGATLVENGLKIAILGSFIKLNDDEISRLFDFGGNAPFSTFSSRILSAFAIGLIGKQARSDLDHIRLVRNVFAHGAFEIGFQHPDVVAICSQFQLVGNKKLPSRDAYIETVALCSDALRNSLGTNKSRIGLYAGAVPPLRFKRNHLP